MNYEKFRTIVSKEEYFNSWDKEQYDQLSEVHRKQIYDKYIIKCVVFQKANCKCENENCQTPDSELTLHHIKFQKNNGKTTVKNGACICKSCHKAFHRGKKSLVIDGATYKIHKEHTINWKELKSQNKDIRRQHREEYGINISWELIVLLMQFLEVNYNESMEDNIEGEDD